MSNNVIYRDPTPNHFPDDYDLSRVDKRVLIRSDSIKYKMRGIDVREALYQGVEIASVVSTEAKELSEETQFLQEELERRFDKQMAGNTDISELIDSRDSFVTGMSFPTLKRRLDFADSVIFKQVPSGFKFIIEHHSEYQPDVKVTSYKNALATETNGFDTTPFFGGETIFNVPTQLSYDRKKIFVEMPLFYALKGEVTIPKEDTLLLISGTDVLCFTVTGAQIKSGNYPGEEPVSAVRVPRELEVTSIDDTTIKLTWKRGE